MSRAPCCPAANKLPFVRNSNITTQSRTQPSNDGTWLLLPLTPNPFCHFLHTQPLQLQHTRIVLRAQTNTLKRDSTSTSSMTKERAQRHQTHRREHVLFERAQSDSTHMGSVQKTNAPIMAQLTEENVERDHLLGPRQHLEDPAIGGLGEAVLVGPQLPGARAAHAAVTAARVPGPAPARPAGTNKNACQCRHVDSLSGGLLGSLQSKNGSFKQEISKINEPAPETNRQRDSK